MKNSDGRHSQQGKERGGNPEENKEEKEEHGKECGGGIRLLEQEKNKSAISGLAKKDPRPP